MTSVETGTGRKPLVTVVIPVWNSGRWLPGCLKALAQQEWSDFELILVDNGSTDGALLDLSPYAIDRIRVIRFSENKGFAVAVNAGIQAAQGELIALLNADTEAEPGWLAALVTEFRSCPPEVGALASCMVQLHDPSLVDDVGDTLSWYGAASKRGHGQPVATYRQREQVDSVCAGAAMYRRRFFDQVGLFDERFVSYLEDVDLCFRGRLLGYGYIYVPSARIRHQGHGSGVHGARYVYLMTRNRLLLLLKNISVRQLIRQIPRIAYGQLYFFIIYRRPLASLRGYLAFMALVPYLVSYRRQFWSRFAMENRSSSVLLRCDKPGPSLRSLAVRHLSCR